MSVDGTWNSTMNTPMGEQKGTMEIQTDGGALTGVMKGAQGEVEFKDGTVDGNNVAWKADITQPMPLTLEFTATVDGDTMTGEAKLGAFGTAPFTATRA